MESPASLHGRCAPWHIGTGNRRQICDFEVQPAPHDQMPRWVQEQSPTLKSTCPASTPYVSSNIQQPELQQQLPFTQQQQQQYFRSQMLPCQQQQQQQQLQRQQQIQRLFGDEMLLSDFERMDGMERKFYVPPTFRNAQNPPQGNKNGVEKKNPTPRPSTNRRECRSMCMPKGMGEIDPNCQGEDYRVNSGYQPSRPGDAVDRRFDPCCKWRPFRDGTSEGHKANHWQFGQDKTSGEGKGKETAGDCEKNACPEKETTIGNRSIYPKLGGMVPGYGGHVPGFERCKFGKTYGRETAEVLRKVNSTEKIPKSYKMAEWRTKCYNREVNC